MVICDEAPISGRFGRARPLDQRLRQYIIRYMQFPASAVDMDIEIK
jgi:hypothetical protein